MLFQQSLKVAQLIVLNSTETVYVVFVLGADIQVSDVFMGKYRVKVHFQLLFICHGSNLSQEETEARLKHLFSRYQASARSHRSITRLIATDNNRYLYFQETMKKEHRFKKSIFLPKPGTERTFCLQAQFAADEHAALLKTAGTPCQRPLFHLNDL